jgi:glc operon protein GlcG
MMMEGITSLMAERALDAARETAGERRACVSISVVDGRGDLVALLRLDGAPWYTAFVSRGKAAAAAAFGVRSGDLALRSESPAIRALALHGDGIIPQQGAVPIQLGEHIVGAVGVSGATSQVDEEIATAGASAVSGRTGR